MSKILKCNCKHESQDKIHGQGNRVHNPCGGNKKGQFRCTVCKDQKTAK